LHDIIERELNGETTLDCHWKSILRVNAVGHLKAFVLNNLLAVVFNSFGFLTAKPKSQNNKPIT
jgi:hypothetical protein